MSYKINTSENNKLVFERVSPGCAMGMFIGIGALFFCIGVGINVYMKGVEFPFILFKLLFPLFGLGAIAVGIYMPKINRETIPELITFDNSKGAVAVQMSKEKDQIGYIRYDEIEKFDIYVEARRTSSSSSRGGSSTSYYYHVFLRKKDGGEWYLTESGSRSKAEEILQKLNKEVHLNSPCTLRVSPELTDKLTKEEFSGKTIVKWHNKVSFFAAFFLLVFSVVFLSILSTAFSGSGIESLDIFPVVVIGFIFIVFCIVIFSVAKRMYKDATTIYSVVIDRQNFEYLESSKSTEAVKKSRILSLKEVYIISYTFTPVKNYGDKGLTVLTKEEFERIQGYKEKPLEVFKDLFSNKAGPIQLTISGLNPVECLQLETWLQELIKKKGDVEVK